MPTKINLIVVEEIGPNEERIVFDSETNNASDISQGKKGDLPYLRLNESIMVRRVNYTVVYISLNPIPGQDAILVKALVTQDILQPSAATF